MTCPVLTLVECWSDLPDPDGLLSSREATCCAGLPDWRKHQFARGRATARTALRLAGCPCEGVDLLRDATGAPTPYTGGGDVPPWSLSVSHSGLWTATAVSPRGLPVGVDIERPDARNHLLAHRLADEDEPLLPYLPATAQICCKEAAFKADHGAHQHLWHYSLHTWSPAADDRPDLMVSGGGGYAWVQACGPLCVVTSAPTRPVVLTHGAPLANLGEVL